MKYRYLGHSGLLVSRVCLGTMTFGMKGWGCDGEAASAITHKFLEAGGNFIDTADMYSKGVSEELLARQSRAATATTWCWRPSAGSACATHPTPRGCPASISCRRAKTAFAG